MTPTDDLRALATLVSNRPPLGVAVVGRPKKPDDAIDQPQSLSLSDDAKEHFYSTIEKAVAKPIADEKLKLVEHDPLYKPESFEVEHAPLADLPALELAADTYKNLGPLGEFTGDSDFVETLRYYVAVFGPPGGEQAWFFRSFTARSELQRKRGAALMRQGGQFDTVDEKIFVFDEAVDCAVYKQQVFIFRKLDFRRVFDQFEDLRDSAVSAADALNQRIPIANFESFREACGKQATMADKIIAIQGRDYFQTLTIDQLELVIQEFSIDVAIAGQGSDRELVFEPDVQHRFLILKLLDDDYLRSSMTDHLYEANSKLQR